MADNDSLRQTLEFFLSEREKKLAEVKAIEFTISQIRKSLGEPVSEFEISAVSGASIPGGEATSVSAGRGASNGRSVTIRPDEFFGLQYSDAARAYLKKVGHAVSMDELLDAMRNGGCKVGGTDPKKILYISLVRNTRDFVPTGNGFLGLREFYPTLPKTTGARSPKTKKKAKRTPKQKATKASAKVDTKEPVVHVQLSKLRDTLVNTMSSGEFMDPKEVVKIVQEKLGDVAPISVYGMLRTKGQFEKSEDGKYRVVTVH